MCECLRREDGTWYVDECCAWVMDAWHNGTLRRELERIFKEGEMTSQELETAANRAGEMIERRTGADYSCALLSIAADLRWFREQIAEGTLGFENRSWRSFSLTVIPKVKSEEAPDGSDESRRLKFKPPPEGEYDA